MRGAGGRENARLQCLTSPCSRGVDISMFFSEYVESYSASGD